MPGPRRRTGYSFEDVGSGLYQYLSSNGDGTGTVELTGNYSAAAAEFYIQDANRYLRLERMIVYVEDSGSIDSGVYGNGINLTNGIKLEYRESDDTLIHDIMGGLPVFTNAEWQGKCHDITLSTWGSGNQGYSVRWTFAKSGNPIILAPGQKLSLILEDNFTGLEKHRFQVQGCVL